MSPVFRRRRTPAPEPPSPLGAPWDGWVRRAGQAAEAVLRAASGGPPGPVRARLEAAAATAGDLATVVRERATWASHAQQLASSLDVDTSTAELKAARRRLDEVRRSGADTTAAEQQVRLLAERHRATHDAHNLAEQAEARLAELVAGLETLAAQAAALALRPIVEDASNTELDRTVTSLAGMRDALMELGS